MYKANAERWAMKEAFDEFFGKAQQYLHMRIDDPFNNEIQQIMADIWEEQIHKHSQIYTT